MVDITVTRSTIVTAELVVMASPIFVANGLELIAGRHGWTSMTH